MRNWAVSPYIQDDIKLTPRAYGQSSELRWDIRCLHREQQPDSLLQSRYPETTPGRRPPGRGATQFGYAPGKANFIGPSTGWATLVPAWALPTRSAPRWCAVRFSVAFLNGGAYEYGTSKTAVNYGNLLVGSFTRLSSGTKPGHLRQLGPHAVAESDHNPVQPRPWRRYADQRLQP